MQTFDILCDMDGILAQCVEKVLLMHRAVTGHVSTVGDIKGWHIGDYLPDGELIDVLFRQPGFFADLEPIPGALQGLELLKSLGHRILIVTSPASVDGICSKFRWLERHLPWISHRDVLPVATKHKWRVSGDILIDDSADTMVEWFQHWAGRKSLGPTLFTIGYPWNESVPPHVARRCGDWTNYEAAWAEIVRLIRLRSGEEL